MIMRSLSKYQGAKTNTKLDRAVLARYFFFLVITQFIIFSLLGTVFKMVAYIRLRGGTSDSILRSLEILPAQIQAAYVALSSYWVG